MQLVRHRILNHESGELLGHVVLRSTENGWTVKTWRRPDPKSCSANHDPATQDYDVWEGQDPLEGGARMVDEVQTYLEAWLYFHRESAIREGAKMAGQPRNVRVVPRKGFRPVSLGALWSQYCNRKSAEAKVVVADARKTFELLVQHGWIKEAPVVPEITLEFPDPWKVQAA